MHWVWWGGVGRREYAYWCPPLRRVPRLGCLAHSCLIKCFLHISHTNKNEILRRSILQLSVDAPYCAGRCIWMAGKSYLGQCWDDHCQRDLSKEDLLNIQEWGNEILKLSRSLPPSAFLSSCQVLVWIPVKSIPDMTYEFLWWYVRSYFIVRNISLGAYINFWRV